MKKKALALLLALTLILALCACGPTTGPGPAENPNTDAPATEPAGGEQSAEPSEAPSTETVVLKVGATPAPHAEILEVVKPILAEQGIDLQITVLNDYIVPNTSTEDGSLDANYFQHITYLNDFNAANDTHLVSVGPVHYEPFGLYAGKTASIDALADGAQIAVPNDATNEARALLLLEQEGLIKLADGVGINATRLDIVENPKNLEIVELEAAQITARLQDVDLAVINGNYAIADGLNIADALATESTEGVAAEAYGNVLAVKEGRENDAAIQALYKALCSDEVKEFINSTYQGAVVPLF